MHSRSPSQRPQAVAALASASDAGRPAPSAGLVVAVGGCAGAAALPLVWSPDVACTGDRPAGDGSDGGCAGAAGGGLDRGARSQPRTALTHSAATGPRRAAYWLNQGITMTSSRANLLS
jgi:hypothetical protein